jgi:hypothetical protein
MKKFKAGEVIKLRGSDGRQLKEQNGRIERKREYTARQEEPDGERKLAF